MFDVAVICYLFLGGLSGGLCVVAAASALSIPVSYLRAGLALEQRRLLGASFVACAGGLLLSALFLMADAGNVAALKYLVLTPNPGYLVLGAWSIAAGILLSLALAIRWRSPEPARGVLFMRALLVLEALIGAVVVVYTGLFLASMFAVPLWNTPWLVALFAASASSCALSAFVALCNALGLSAAFSCSLTERSCLSRRCARSASYSWPFKPIPGRPWWRKPRLPAFFRVTSPPPGGWASRFLASPSRLPSILHCFALNARLRLIRSRPSHRLFSPSSGDFAFVTVSSWRECIPLWGFRRNNGIASQKLYLRG